MRTTMTGKILITEIEVKYNYANWSVFDILKRELRHQILNSKVKSKHKVWGVEFVEYANRVARYNPPADELIFAEAGWYAYRLKDGIYEFLWADKSEKVREWKKHLAFLKKDGWTIWEDRITADMITKMFCR